MHNLTITKKTFILQSNGYIYDYLFELEATFVKFLIAQLIQGICSMDLLFVEEEGICTDVYPKLQCMLRAAL